MKRIQLITLIVIIALSACYKQIPKPGQPGNYTYYLIPQTLKDYAEFKPGTYWIYQDSTTGKIDSQYVIELDAGIDTFQNTITGSGKGIFEWYNEHVNTTFDTSDSWYSVTTYRPSIQPDIIGFQDWHYYNHTTMETYLAEIVYLIYPFTDHSYSYGLYSDTVNNVITYTNYTVNGRIYSNIVKVYETNNPTHGNQPENHYIADHIGIIRRELLRTNHVWNLIRYHIVQ